MQNKDKKIIKISNKNKLIVILAVILVIAIVSTIIIRKVMISNELNESEYLATENANSSLIAGYIKKGVTIGGITGTFEVLDTSDATATPEDIAEGKTAYVKGVKITGTRKLGTDDVTDAIDSGRVFEKDTTIKDDLQNDVRIPGGFHLAEDSATKVEDGIVIEDNVGNQFVWIPAKTGAGAIIHTTAGDKTIIYQRTDFGQQDGNYSDYSESLPADEEASVNANGGYYIGRYEAGDKVLTDAGKMRVKRDSQTNEVSIKKGQAPYNYITHDKSKILAEGMGSSRGYTGTTKLVSSYAWDTAINFIQIKTPDYGTNSPQGNYYDTTFSYANVGKTEKTQTKAKSSSTLVPTGQTTPVSNIYDMGGNCLERTTGVAFFTDYPVCDRGGWSSVSASEHAAGSLHRNTGDASSVISFRVTLFCSTER